MPGGGGSTTSTSIYYEYNDRLASIYEAQQAMADKYFQFWESDYKPFEQAQIEANQQLLPEQTGLQLDSIKSASTLLPYQTTNEIAGLNYTTGAAQDKLNQLKISEPVVQEYYTQALKGVDVGGEMNRAQADIQQQISNQKDQSIRDASRMGINVNSGSFQKNLTNTLDNAKATAGARNQAYRTTKTDNFNKLNSAMQMRG